MALQLIFGSSGSGKSHYLYQNIIERSRKHPEKNYMVLVPEQFTMQTQKDLVLMHPDRGIMNIDVLSFGRLAHRIFEETGAGGVPVLDDEGKSLILRKIAGDYEEQLKVLKGNIRKLGYISEVKSVISEFTQYDIGQEELAQMQAAAGEGSYLYYKLKDMEVLYNGFRDYLREKYITKEELLDVLCRTVEESKLLKKSTVVLDGFTGFTPVQVRLMKELMRCCEDVMVTVTMDQREDPFTYSHPYQLYGISKQMTTSLIRTAQETQVPVKEPVYLYQKPVYRFRENQALGFLEQSLFRYSGNIWNGGQDAVTLHTARNPKEEAYAAAGHVRSLIREQGYRYRDIGVIVSDMSSYGEYLEQAFRAYHIPVFMDYKRSILLNSFVEYIRSLIAMVQENFTYDSVFRFLRAGYTSFSAEETDALENYTAALGMKGYKMWQSRWLRPVKGMAEEELTRLNHLRRAFVEQIDGLVYVLKQRRKTVRDITESVYEFLAEQGLQQRLREQEEWFQGRGQLAMAREYSQIYGIVLELFDKFVKLLGEEPVSLEEYARLLDAGLNEAKVGVIPPGVDQVVIGDMERTRLKDVKALLLLGANDTHLPGELGQGGLLSEHDREKFARENLVLTPQGKEKAYIQKFYLYLNLTKPTEKLALYYSKVTAEGKSIRPSYLIQEIHRLYPDLAVTDEEQKTLRDRELTEEMAVGDLIEGLRMTSQTSAGAWMELYSWYITSSKWREKTEVLTDACFYKRPADQISRLAAARLYGEDFEDSITRMEQFSACEFAHYLKYGLRLKERQEYEFRALDMGNVFHHALEKYAHKAELDGRGWTGIPERDRSRMAEESVEEAVTDYGNSVLYSSARNEYMITRMKRMMNRTVWALTRQLEQGDFRPSAYEMRFGNGKIDRVDTCETGDAVYVKVLDYKTGTKAFDITALYHGLQLQLMVYMDVAVKLTSPRYPGKEVIPSGVFYYQMEDPLVEKGTAESVERAILKELKPDGLVNLEKDSLTHLDRNAQGESEAVPVKWNKDGSLSKSSKAVSGEDFRVLLEHADRKVREIHGRIADGEAEVKPYKWGSKTGCDYCVYRNICGFDEKIPGYDYRIVDKLSREEAIGKMKGEQGS